MSSALLLRRSLLAVAVIVAAAGWTWAAKATGDVAISYARDGGYLRVDDTIMPLVGKGVRTAMWVEVYACYLYLPHAAASVDEIKAEAMPVAVDVRILVDGSLAEIPERWRKVFQREVSVEAYARLMQVSREIARYDHVTFVYRPEDGTRVLHNGRAVAYQPGKSLMNALLDQWLGNEPVSRSLRASLLGDLAAR